MAIVTNSSNSVRADHSADPISWQEAMRSAIRDPVQLCRLLDLPADYEKAAKRAAAEFGVFVPRSWLDKIEPGCPSDPLLRQVLPLEDELDGTSGVQDPVGDRFAQVGPGLIQKYQGRVLMIVTGICPVHCRYCFRRHFPYSEAPRSMDAWQSALERIALDPQIEEVLLSGGDPLTQSDARLGSLIDKLAEIPHLRRLRIHTRMPIMIPQRVTKTLLEMLRGTRLTVLVVVHTNHPAEIDEPVADVFRKFVDAGMLVLNQAVLLRGVNDNAAVLIDLCRRLIDLRVMPYYLHQLDPVAGATHFKVPIQHGRELIHQLRSALPGYAVPRYVQEIPGQDAKMILE